MTDSDDVTPDAPLGVPDDVSAAELDQIALLLRDLPPITMPDDVVARLDAALRAAPPLAIDSSLTPLATARERSSRRLAWSGRAVGVAAGIAGLLVVTGVAYPLLTNPSGTDATALSGVEAGAADAQQMPPIELMSSGTDYTVEQLPSQVDSVLTQAEQSRAMVAPDVSDKAVNEMYERVADQTALRGCVTELAQSDRATPLAVDLARFSLDDAVARPALVVVLPSATDPAEVEVFVVAPTCTGPDLSLLYFRVIATADLAALDDGAFTPAGPSPSEAASATPSTTP